MLRRRLFICISISLLLAACMVVQPKTIEGDAVTRIAYRFRVPKERVIELANSLGVDPAKIDDLGAETFPLNYYGRKLEPTDESMRPRRSEVLRLVNGYTAMCKEDETMNYSLLYFFYSKALVQPASEIPLLMKVHFKQPAGVDDPDPRVSAITMIDLSESEFNPPGSQTYLDCVNQRGHFSK